MNGAFNDRVTPVPDAGPDTLRLAENWRKHVVRAGRHSRCVADEPDPDEHREQIEPWLSALFQAEHLNVLVGGGLTTAIAKAADAPEVGMNPVAFQCTYADDVMRAAQEGAKRLGRNEPNIEDQVRTINELIGGLRILALGVEGDDGDDDEPEPSAATALREWESALDGTLAGLMKRLLATERGIAAALSGGQALFGPEDDGSARVRRLLGGFLLPFASRTATRERTHIFTTNYDRLIERGCDLLGLRLVDRFVGSLAPVFHSSRLGIDLHYNPPGIRGEPRYLEGVVRFTKLHGSVDWRSAVQPSSGLNIQRCGLPFGAADNHPDVPAQTGEQLIVYPNAAKDLETLEFPYAELFRDFAAAVCQPNAVVVTYGYGFGDDHVNRVLRDMLSIPSTHLVVISHDEAGGRLKAFHDLVGHEAQTTLLVGSHFGDLATLVEHYLPKPAIDRTTWRMVDLLNRRARPRSDDDGRRAHGGLEGEELA
jgi:hypothetical protein